MIYFPQLSTGATGQFPIRKRRLARTVQNQSREKYNVKVADPGAEVTEWHLSFAELTDQELAALEVLFQTSEGRLGTFTFLDPTDNLLAWSERLDEAVWQTDPLLRLTGSVPGPLGGTGAFRLSNPTGARLKIQQTIAAPASLSYCLSVYARSDEAGRVWLVRGSGTDARATAPQWARLVSAGNSTDTAENITFGLALDPGSTADVFGFQVEAQISASAYKTTADKGGIYSTARFRDDVLTITSAGPNRHSCELDIVNVEHL